MSRKFLLAAAIAFAPFTVQQVHSQEIGYRLGWIYAQYLSCDPSDPGGYCSTSVDADGVNVWQFPNGPITSALVNGVPVVIVEQQGSWVRVNALCQLYNTGVWSDTAGVPLFGANCDSNK